MQPRGLRIGRIVPSSGDAFVEFEEAIHLGVDVLGRAVLMDDAIRPHRVVRPLLPAPLRLERDLDPVALEVDACDGGLMAGDELVPALHVVRGQRAAPRHVLEHHVVGCFLVREQPANDPVVDPLEGMRAHRRREPFGHELLRHAPAQGVESLDLSGLKRERAHSLPQPAFQEPLRRRVSLQRGAARGPLLGKRGITRCRPSVRVRGHPFQRAPFRSRLGVHGRGVSRWQRRRLYASGRAALRAPRPSPGRTATRSDAGR